MRRNVRIPAEYSLYTWHNCSSSTIDSIRGVVEFLKQLGTIASQRHCVWNKKKSKKCRWNAVTFWKFKKSAQERAALQKVLSHPHFLHLTFNSAWCTLKYNLATTNLKKTVNSEFRAWFFLAQQVKKERSATGRCEFLQRKKSAKGAKFLGVRHNSPGGHWQGFVKGTGENIPIAPRPPSYATESPVRFS